MSTVEMLTPVGHGRTLGVPAIPFPAYAPELDLGPLVAAVVFDATRPIVVSADARRRGRQVRRRRSVA